MIRLFCGALRDGGNLLIALWPWSALTASASVRPGACECGLRLLMPMVALVVDDSMLIRYTVCHFLEQRGFAVESATNGEEALRNPHPRAAGT